MKHGAERPLAFAGLEMEIKGKIHQSAYYDRQAE
jgi:hypothetical protein